MQKKSILVAIASFTALGLVSCGGGTPSSSSGSGSSSQSPSSSSSSSSQSSSSTGSSSSQTSSGGSSSSSSNPSKALSEAFKKDYSNSTAFIGQLYDGGETEEDAYEYYADGYQIVYDSQAQVTGEAASYLFYHDYENESYLYFDGDTAHGEKKGWLTKGYKDTYVGLGSSYLDLRALAKCFDENVNKYNYISGVYLISDEAAVKAIVDDAFSFAWFNTIDTISISLDEETGAMATIKAFDTAVSVDKNLVQINVSNIGSTQSVGTLPAAPSENNVYEYWQYKGWTGPLKNVYPTSVSLPEEAKTLEIEHSVTLTPTFVMEKGDETKNHIEEDRTLTAHSSDEKILKVEGGSLGGDITITALAAGDAEVYVTASSADGEDKGVSSNRVSVHVNGLQKQNLEGAVYNLSFTGKSGSIIGAENSITGTAPYEVSANEGVSVSSSAADSGVFGTTSALILSPFGQQTMNTEEAGNAVATFDFSDQEVSGVSFYYGGYYSNFKQNASSVSKIALETSSDGKTWTEVADIKDEVIANISHDNFHLIERSFGPASKVRLRVDGDYIGKVFDLALPSIAFIADENCHNHGEVDKVPVSSINISSSKSVLYVGQSEKLSFVVLPNNATDKTLDYASSDESVLSVSNGTVTALKSGSATITATAHDGSLVKSNVLAFTVKDMPVMGSDYDGVFKGFDDGVDTLSITVSTANKSLSAAYKGKTYALSLTDYDDENSYFVFASGDDKLSIYYSSFDKTMNVKGTLGGAPIKYGNGNPITLTRYIALTSLSIAASKGETSIIGGGTVVLKASLTPSNATDLDLEWTSSNPEVLAVPSDYEPTSLSILLTSTKVSADTDVTISAKDKGTGLISNLLTLTVKAEVKVSSIVLSAAKTTLEAGESVLLSSSITPEGATNKELVFSSSDDKVATVDKTGLVKAASIKKDTSVTITATAADGSLVKGTIVILVKATSATNPLASTSWEGTDEDYANTFTLSFDADLKLTISGGFASDPETLSLSSSSVSGTATTYVYADGMAFTSVKLVYDSSDGSLILDVDGGSFYDGVVNYSTNITFTKK